MVECPLLQVVQDSTDGCTSQYIGNFGFAYLSKDEKNIHRNFFESSHERNVCDGLGATVKNICHQAVIGGSEVISNAEDLYQRYVQKLTINTHAIIYVDIKKLLTDLVTTTAPSSDVSGRTTTQQPDRMKKSSSGHDFESDKGFFIQLTDWNCLHLQNTCKIY